MEKILTEVDLLDLIKRYYPVFISLYPDRELTLTEVEEETGFKISRFSKFVNRVKEYDIFKIRLEKRDRGRPSKYIKLSEGATGMISSLIEMLKPVHKSKYGASVIEFLVRILRDRGLPQKTRITAGRKFLACCSSEGEIEGGKGDIRNFFVEFLEDLSGYEKEELVNISIALGHFIAFQLEADDHDEADDYEWVRKTCSPKLVSIFTGDDDINLRKMALRTLSKIYDVEKLQETKQDLTEIFRRHFLDPLEDDGVAQECWNIVWKREDEEEREDLMEELFKMVKSKDVRIRERGLRCLEGVMNALSDI